MDSQIKGNEGEQFVNQLAFSTFFKYWCYPSPKLENGNKKEICDLLIIFKDIVIIFSVKNYEFKGNHNRYFNSTISKATKQINGAYKTLFSRGEVYIKHPDKEFQEIFPKHSLKKVFRIIVNLGENTKFYPFSSTSNNGDFITLFDKDSFETIIKELDTVPDFIDYIEKREKLFKDKFTIILPAEEDDFSIETQKEFFSLTENSLINNNKTVLLSGTEKDLLAYFFENKREFPEILKDETVNGFYLVIDNKWNEFISKKSFENKKEADKISYFVDRFVENELLINITPYREELAKYLLSFDRLARRSIGESYFDFHNKNANNTGLYFGRRLVDFGSIGILFTSYTEEMSDEIFNTLNNLALESFNVFTRYKYPIIILTQITQLKFFEISLWGNPKFRRTIFCVFW